MSQIQLRRVAHLQRGAGFPHDVQGDAVGELPFFKVGDFGLEGNGRYLRACNNWVSRTVAHRLGAAPVPTGTVLLPKIGAALLGNARRITTQESVFDNNVLGVVPHEIDTRYLYFWLSIQDLGRIANPGPIPSLDDSAFLELAVPIGKIERQRTIAEFLDAETARIDTLITMRRRMIGLLESRFAHVIVHAIIGTDVPGPRRQSGIAWMGEIPARWGTPRLGANYHTQLGKMLNAEAAAGPEQFPYLRNANVHWDHFELDDLPTMHFGPEDRARCELKDGDLLVCEGGEVGRSAVWSGQAAPVYFQKAIHRVRSLRGDSTRFLMYCLRAAAYLGVFTIEGNQSTIVHLTGEKLREHRFPLPPRHEQERIVLELDTQRDRLVQASRRLGDQTSLLRERRQALITAAVTGELDIPSAAA